MDKILEFLLLICFFVALLGPTLGAQPYKALVAPITQLNPSTYLHTITLNRNEKLLIDIDSPYSWHHCPKGFYRVSCQAPQCLSAKSYRSPFCNNVQVPKNRLPCSCVTFPYNPITKTCAQSLLTYTNISISSTNGRNPLAKVTYNKVYVSCAPKTLLQSLPKGSSGVASLSRAPLSLISQFSTPSVVKKFGLCFASQGGVAFFGDGPYDLLPINDRDVTKILSYTPLLKHPTDPLGYYISLKGIAIANNAVKFDTKQLSIDSLGNGGIKISTVTPYTTLRSNIYRKLIGQYATTFSNVPSVPKVAPFGLCLNSTFFSFSRVGILGPIIDFELSNGANWTVYGYNSLKQASTDVWCLAFVDGGEKAKQAMVIGTYQMQDNFLQFDLVKSRLGFSSLLFFSQTNCNNFNFTSGVN